MHNSCNPDLQVIGTAGHPAAERYAWGTKVFTSLLLLASSALPALASPSNPDSIVEQPARVIQMEIGSAAAYGMLPGNTSIIRQEGTGNRASTVQSYSHQYQLGNLAIIWQQGHDNVANITQQGGSNLGTIVQLGDHHQASLYQAGYQIDLKAQITQRGQGSDIHLNQSGSGYRSISIDHLSRSGVARPVAVDTR